MSSRTGSADQLAAGGRGSTDHKVLHGRRDCPFRSPFQRKTILYAFKKFLLWIPRQSLGSPSLRQKCAFCRPRSDGHWLRLIFHIFPAHSEPGTTLTGYYKTRRPLARQLLADSITIGTGRSPEAAHASILPSLPYVVHVNPYSKELLTPAAGGGNAVVTANCHYAYCERYCELLHTYCENGIHRGSDAKRVHPHYHSTWPHSARTRRSSLQVRTKA